MRPVVLAFDPALWRWILVAAIVALLVVAVIIARAVQKLATKVVVIVLIGVLAAVLWYSRAELGECVRTCSCQILGQDVEVDDDVCDRIPDGG